MKREGTNQPGLWPPTSIQKLVLRAALLAAPQALKDWQSWCSEMDIERSHPDPESYALLGLVGYNLRAAAPDDPLMGRLRGIQRRTWYVNQKRMQAAVEAMAVLEQAGISTLLLDGAAMIAAYYDDPGLRPLDAVTLLVRPGDAWHALSALTGAGWQARHAGRPRYVALAHACTLTRPDGQSVRVQWRLVAHDARPDADDVLWLNAQTGVLQGRPVGLPAAESLLLGLCSDLFGAPPACGWSRLADMAAVLRASPPDWAGVIEQARQRRMAGLLRLALGCLADLDTTLPIPPDALADLDAQPLSPAEKSFCAAVQCPLTLIRRIELSWRHWRLTQACEGRNLLWAAVTFAPHLRYAPDHFGARATVRQIAGLKKEK